MHTGEEHFKAQCKHYKTLIMRKASSIKKLRRISTEQFLVASDQRSKNRSLVAGRRSQKNLHRFFEIENERQKCKQIRNYKMDQDDELLILILLRRRFQENNAQIKKKRRYKIKPVLRERRTKGEFRILVNQVRYFYPEEFFKMFRMSPGQFETLLSWVAPHIMRDPTKGDIIPPDERLCVTLRLLATGDSFTTIGQSYRISGTTIGRLVPETCNVLWTVLSEKGYLKAPNTPDEWRKISNKFEQRWNFPNCVGAIDGKHVIIQSPPRAGSMFYNYKKFHSIVLMATVNANYEFILVDVGDYGRLSDGSVFSTSNFGIAINNDKLNLPPPRKLINSGPLYPYVFTGDDAFPLKPCLMKPYPGVRLPEAQRIANYRMCRARRIVENAFGIATSRFRIFRRPICAGVDTAVAVTKAVVSLHNYLMKEKSISQTHYFEPTLVDRMINITYVSIFLKDSCILIGCAQARSQGVEVSSTPKRSPATRILVAGDHNIAKYF